MRNLLLIGLVFTAACTVGPNYHRPTIATPESFRAPEPLPPGQADSFADLKWFEVFKDEQLQALIRRALERNYDLRDAVARADDAKGTGTNPPLVSVPTFDPPGAPTPAPGSFPPPPSVPVSPGCRPGGWRMRPRTAPAPGRAGNAIHRPAGR